MGWRRSTGSAISRPGRRWDSSGVGAIWTTDADTTSEERLRTDFAYSVALGRGLIGRLAAFVEGYGIVGVSAERTSWHALDGGFVFALEPNVQVDVSGGFGHRRAPVDWFLSGGVSVRVPRRGG